MKGAIASVEIYLFEAFEGHDLETSAPESAGRRSRGPDASLRSPSPTGRPRRLSLVIGTPERSSAGDAWQCRVALADLHRPEICEGRDSIEALFLAVAQAKSWLAALQAAGFVLARDRAGDEPFPLALGP
jgi:hypothetical protein